MGNPCNRSGFSAACETMPPLMHPMAMAETICFNSLLAISSNPNRTPHDPRMVRGWDLAELGLSNPDKGTARQAFKDAEAFFCGVNVDFKTPLGEQLRAQHAINALPLLAARRFRGRPTPEAITDTYRRHGRLTHDLLPFLYDPRTDILRDDTPQALVGLLAETMVQGLLIRTKKPEDVPYTASLREDGGEGRFARFNQDCYQLDADGNKIPIQIKYLNGGVDDHYDPVVASISLVGVCRQAAREIRIRFVSPAHIARLLYQESQGIHLKDRDRRLLDIATEIVKCQISDHTTAYLAKQAA